MLAKERSRLGARARAITDDFIMQALARVGLEVPLAALRVSDLVPLDERVRVVRDLAPELLARTGQVERSELEVQALQTWLDEQLHPCGSDPRSLVAEGIEAALDELDAAEPDLRARAVELLRNGH